MKLPRVVCERGLNAHWPSVRIVQQHLQDSPMLGRKRALDGAGVRRLEAVGCLHRNDRLELQRLDVGDFGQKERGSTGGVPQLARVVIRLELQLKAEALPEGDGLAPVVRLDEQMVD